MIKKLIKSPLRFSRVIQKKVRNRIFNTAYILLYHRIADVKNDPLQLCVSRINFRNQLIYLKQNYNIVPLVQSVLWLRKGQLKDQSVAITFDDGYADNLHNALPILKELNIPATIFVASGFINSDKPFFWDINTPQEDRGRPISREELLELARCNLVEIGAHTITHPRLSAMPESSQKNEIEGSKNQLEKILGHSPISFAYPFGDKESYDKNTMTIIRNGGFNYACSNIHNRITKKSNLYALPRFIVRNWTVEELKEEIKKWV